ncbi:RNA polymerase sigma-70 factor [Fulvivirgaceae bacterium BMA12]|uniref:RNA polymerase sigma-70 factor n=1 Tax=Agaribacillus aureus TaxID=3051825 RepID=A0ABT8L6W1_9BACT|nr:RNA polymerase sigma-70 factor [Fulvivirgaceae bacterium BMA12]
MQKLKKELLERLLSGDANAFEELYDLYREPAIRFCNTILKDVEESENIIQEVFLKIWNKRETINPTLNFTSYLFTIIKNSVFDQLKEIKKNEALKEMYWQNVLVYKAVDSDIKEERLLKVKKAVEELSEKRKRIIKLNYEEGKSYEEIANQLNISKNTVKNQLIKAKQIIRKQLEVVPVS